MSLLGAPLEKSSPTQEGFMPATKKQRMQPVYRYVESVFVRESDHWEAIKELSLLGGAELETSEQVALMKRIAEAAALLLAAMQEAAVGE